jgi:hypothetical protein
VNAAPPFRVSEYANRLPYVDNGLRDSQSYPKCVDFVVKSASISENPMLTAIVAKARNYRNGTKGLQ